MPKNQRPTTRYWTGIGWVKCTRQEVTNGKYRCADCHVFARLLFNMNPYKGTPAWRLLCPKCVKARKAQRHELSILDGFGANSKFETAHEYRPGGEQ